ncbi:hypothetical protein C8R46DRAFT_995765, partial [Mycena filopes]
ALERDRSAVQQELDDTSTLPILTLPIEVTTEIFTWCLPTIEKLRADHPHAPLTLASCCRSWRAIALATPALWSTFPVILKDDSFTKPGQESFTDFADWWLGRAAAIQPLTFVLHTPPRPPSNPHDDNQSDRTRTSLRYVREALLRYAPRLERLDLVADVLDLSFLPNLHSVDFPLLQRIVVRNHHVQYPASDTSLGQAPQFYELFLRDSALLSSFSLPLDRLTRFEGGIESDR